MTGTTPDLRVFTRWDSAWLLGWKIEKRDEKSGYETQPTWQKMFHYNLHGSLLSDADKLTGDLVTKSQKCLAAKTMNQVLDWADRALLKPLEYIRNRNASLSEFTWYKIYSWGGVHFSRPLSPNPSLIESREGPESQVAVL